MSFLRLCAPRQLVQRLVPTGFPIIIAVTWFGVGFFTSDARPPAECVWTVEGTLRVLDDVFVPNTSQWKGLEDVEVKVQATTLPAQGWTNWGTVRTDASGHYRVSVVPAQSSPQGCRRSRRLRVKARLDGPRARISRDEVSTYKIDISDPSVWHSNDDPSGRTVVLNIDLQNLVDEPQNPRFEDTRAAQMYLGYRALFLQLKSWDLHPRKGRVRWPAATAFAAPHGWVHIHRGWFDNPSSYIKRELTHEYVHEWWYENVYTPRFTSGPRLFDTHDFLEHDALTLFEEAAEVLAFYLNEATFGIEDTRKDRLITARDGIRCRFETARRRQNGNPYFTTVRVDEMVSAGGAEWRKLLDRANVSVRNNLAMLLIPNWFGLDWDRGRTNSNTCPGRPVPDKQALISQQQCAGLPAPMFDVHQLMDGLRRWGVGGVRERDRNLTGLYEYLGERSPYSSRFGPHYKRFLWLGDPHFAGLEGMNGFDACQSPAPARRQRR